MKKLVLLLIMLCFTTFVISQVYNTCASAASGTSLANGSCIDNASFGGSVNMSGICLGGNNPAMYIPFVAGSCSQFTINPDFSLNPTGQSFGYTVLTTGCSNALVVTECVGNIVQDQDFTISGISYNGGTQLVSGTKYVLRLYGAVPAGGTIDICYNANTPEEPSNECGGALGLGTSPTTYFNGGDCSYNGTYDDTPSNPSFDAAPIQYCAGSLENTQWVNFSPVAGASSFQIVGTNINCTAGACAYQFGIFSGSCGSLTNEGCVSNGNPCANGPDPNSAISQAGGNDLTWSGVSDVGFTATIAPPSGTFNGTEEFYLVMDGNSDAQCYYTLTGINVQTLPIELVYFKVSKYNNSNKISFRVASQINNDYFTIQRSENGVNWSDIKIISGAGTLNQVMDYGYNDFEYSYSLNYYRLKQTDFNGEYEYSDIDVIDNRIEDDIYLLRKVNLMGVEVGDDYHGLVIEIYNNGTSRKCIKD